MEFGGRGRLSGVVGTLLICGLMAGSALLAAIFPERFLEGDSPQTRLIARFLAVAFGAIFLIAARTSRLALRPCGLIIDAEGITWYGYGGDQVGSDGVGSDGGREPARIAWSEIRAVGIGYMAGTWSRPAWRRMPTGVALEFYPADCPLDDRLPFLRAATEPRPRPDLPDQRYRLPIPPLVAGDLERAVRRYAPRHWIGRYPRRWRRLPGR